MKKPPLIYDKAMHEARKYWRDRLEAMSFEGHVPPDHPRPADGQPRLASLEQALDPEAHARLRRLTGGNPSLSYTALVLALQICCYRYSGRPQVTLLGPGPEGAAADLLPLGSTLDRGSSFKDALLATKELLAGAYRHPQYPFSRLVLDLREDRRPKHLFMIASMAGLHGEVPDEPCDLAVRFETSEAGTRATFRYDGRLYDASTILHFFEAFSGILRRGIGDMAIRIADLRPERGRAPEAAAAGTVGAEGELLHRLIEARAALQGDRATTYAAPDRRAAQLAEPRDTAHLAERLMAPEITVWDLPAALMQNLLADLLALRARRPELRGPRTILLTGEEQSVPLAVRLARLFPDARITGLYAHPAVGIWSTAFLFEPGAAAPGDAAIAQAVPGFAHEVVNEAGEPALLHTRGALRLRRSPAAAEPGAPSSPEAVETGLRAELLEGGRVRWLRGEEHAVVERGCRVELTGIEAVLCEHEHVLGAEVIAVAPDRAADGRVVAFLLVAEPDQVSAEAARDHLVRRGVDLVPDRFIAMTEFPLTADGAIDRDALRARAAASDEPRGNARDVAVDEIQRQLKAMWLEILELDEVGEDDSFFAQGGNSLKATLLLARIEGELAVELSVQKFFQEPSLRAVARLIAAEAGSAAGPAKGAELKAVSREQYRARLPDAEP